mgnify:CR=1 FL=1
MGKIYKSLDILKLISAICIVGLHCFRFNNDLYDYCFVCATRFGVPCFFIISAFLLFKQSPNWEKMKVFAKRIAKLYLFWLIVTAPLTIYLRLIANHNLSFAEKFLNLIHTSLFSVSFPGSWYLMALLQCSFIIYFLKKYLTNSVILLISLAVYILPCIAASYNYLFDTEHIITHFISIFTDVIFRPYHCFPAGLIYVAIGMFIAENYQKIMDNISLAGGGIMLYINYLCCIYRKPLHLWILWRFKKRLRLLLLFDTFGYIISNCSTQNRWNLFVENEYHHNSTNFHHHVFFTIYIYAWPMY